MLRQISTLIAITLIAILEAAAQQTSPATRTVLIRKNTVLKLSLMKSLDPLTAHAGDDVPLLLIRPLVVGPVTVLHVGEVMHGQVTKVKRPSRSCRSGNGHPFWGFRHLDLSTGVRRFLIRSSFSSCCSWHLLGK